MKTIPYSFLMLFSLVGYAGPFNIYPKADITLPANVTPGYNVTAYYTVSNNTSSNRVGNYVKYLPTNVSQVTTGGDYADTCGSTFNLTANGGSCTLQLSISDVVGPDASNPNNYLFVSLPGGKAGAGTNYPLNVALNSWLPLTVSYEIIYTANAIDHPKDFLQTYKDAGSNPINGTEWETYTPPEGYTINTTRYLQFDESISLNGPGDPTGTQTYITTSDGYTWGAISNVINAMWPFHSFQYTFPANTSPFEAGNLVTTPPAGVIKVTTNYKSQLMKYYANENDVPPGTPGAIPILRYYIIDPWGNEYLMQASDYSTADDVTYYFEAATLPPGWTKETRFLEEDLILHPAQGPGNTAEYTILRDDQNNTYNQTYWSTNGITITAQVEASGMPIWGGLVSNVIRITNSFDNLIYGGGGVTAFIFSSDLTAGTNTITDFNPYLGDTLNFSGQTYTQLISTLGIEFILSGGATVILEGVYQFSTNWVVN
ncbi:MAG: hypothetical protein V4489_06125 [Chlamydiota bacterium]